MGPRQAPREARFSLLPLAAGCESSNISIISITSVLRVGGPESSQRSISAESRWARGRRRRRPDLFGVSYDLEKRGQPFGKPYQHTLTHTHTHSLSLSLSHTHSLTHTLSLSHTQTLREQVPFLHFAGNFWWTTCSRVRKLEVLKLSPKAHLLVRGRVRACFTSPEAVP